MNRLTRVASIRLAGSSVLPIRSDVRGSDLRRLRASRLFAPLAVLVLGSAVSMTMRWGPDWPAQEFRGWLALHHGLIVWTNNWYAGSSLPSYSVLYPVLASFLGVGAIGVTAAVVAAAGANALAETLDTRPASLFDVAVALVLLQLLVIGQIPFLMSVAFGVWSFWCAQSVSRWSAASCAILAAASGLSNPLAAVFIIVLIPAIAVSLGARRALPLFAAVAGLAVPLIVGSDAGRFATQWESLAAITVFVAIVLLVKPAEVRALKSFASCYLIVTIVIFVVPNPIGSNITRLGKLVALPLVCYAISDRLVRTRTMSVILLVLATTWTSIPVVTAIARGAIDSSQNASFYTGLLHFLRTQNPTRGRLEIPFTREHWETSWVARAFPIARGWERQVDLHYNSLLYRPLTSSSYRTWLEHNAVSLVGVPRAPLDYGGRPEARLLRDPPTYLTPVWHDKHWTVWRVRNPVAVMSGPGTLEATGPASFVVRFAKPGSAIVRFRASKLWQITSGYACITSNSDGWLVVRSPKAGTVTARARLNSGLFSSGSTCHD